MHPLQRGRLLGALLLLPEREGETEGQSCKRSPAQSLCPKPHFTGEEAKAQRGAETCPRSHSRLGPAARALGLPFEILGCLKLQERGREIILSTQDKAFRCFFCLGVLLLLFVFR